MAEIIPENVSKKIQLYSAAIYLFEYGKSHPQIVERLSVYEPDPLLLATIVDKAMKEEWDNLYEEARILFGNGATYDEVLQIISMKEPDIEIATFICGNWYELRFFYVDCINEAPAYIAEGIEWIIICVIALPILFWMGASWFVKGIWILLLVIAIAVWLGGLYQRKLARKIDHLFNVDPKSIETDENQSS